MKPSGYKEGLKQRQQQFDSSNKSPLQGYRRPGSLSGPGPTSKERYRRGIATKRSQQAAAQRGAA